jgi:hypothetical protein
MMHHACVRASACVRVMLRWHGVLMSECQTINFQGGVVAGAFGMWFRVRAFWVNPPTRFEFHAARARGSMWFLIASLPADQNQYAREQRQNGHQRSRQRERNHSSEPMKNQPNRQKEHS